jgi:hypothetical protein
MGSNFLHGAPPVGRSSRDSHWVVPRFKGLDERKTRHLQNDAMTPIAEMVVPQISKACCISDFLSQNIEIPQEGKQGLANCLFWSVLSLKKKIILSA